MSWKFWRKNEGGDSTRNKMPKPKELPEHMGMYLVVKEKLDPDWVWSLKCARCPRENDKSIYDFRIYSDSDAAEAGVHVANYLALDDHTELILFFGHSDKRGDIFQIEKVVSGKAA